jgi:hypothetical protein
MADVTITYVTEADLLRKLGPAYQEIYGQPIPSQISEVPLVIQFKTKPNGYLTADGDTLGMTSDSHADAANWTLTPTSAGENPGFLISASRGPWLTANADKTVGLSDSQEPWELITDNVAPGNNLRSAGSVTGFAEPSESGLTLVEGPSDANKCFVGVWGPAN